MEPPFAVSKPVTQAALQWAVDRHGGQLRAVDWAPFVLHPLEVAAQLSARDYDDEVVAAGLLHDLVEDTETSLDEIRATFGPRVASMVATLTEDPSIEDYEDRKRALRDAAARGDPETQAIYAADKVVKARELRAEAARAARRLDEPALRRRLEHYEHSLEMLREVAPDLALTQQLAFELWALRQLPPAG